MRYIRLVREFNNALDPESARLTPGTPFPGKRLLRAQLILEELAEVTEAFCSGDLHNVLCEMLDLQYVLDGALCVYGADTKMEVLDWEMSCAGPPRMPDSEDALLMFIGGLGKAVGELINSMIGGGDWQVVGTNALFARGVLFTLWSSLGVPEALRWDMFQALHAANMAKLGGGKNEAGRVQKPEGWRRADQRTVLARHGYMIAVGSPSALTINTQEKKPC